MGIIKIILKKIWNILKHLVDGETEKCTKQKKQIADVTAKQRADIRYLEIKINDLTQKIKEIKNDTTK